MQLLLIFMFQSWTAFNCVNAQEINKTNVPAPRLVK